MPAPSAAGSMLIRRHSSLYWRIVPLMVGLVMLGSGAISFFTLRAFQAQVHRFDAQVIEHEVQVAGTRLRQLLEDLSSKTFNLSQSATLGRLQWAADAPTATGAASYRLQATVVQQRLQETILARNPQIQQVLTVVHGPTADMPAWVIGSQRNAAKLVATEIFPYALDQDLLLDQALQQDGHSVQFSAFGQPDLDQGVHFFQSSTPFSAAGGTIQGHVILRQAASSFLQSVSDALQHEGLMFLFLPSTEQLYHLGLGVDQLNIAALRESIAVLRESTATAVASHGPLALYDMSTELGYGGLILGMGRGTPLQNPIVERAVQFNLQLQLGVIIAFMLASLVAAKSITRPIESLRQKLSVKREHIGPEDLPGGADSDLKALFDVIVENAVQIRTQNEDLQERLQDLTRARDELRQAYDRIQDSEEQRAIFIKIIAHDLREPLLITKSYAELLPEMLAEDDQDGLQRSIGFMAEALQRMTSLLESMRRHFAIGTAEELAMVRLAPLARAAFEQMEPPSLREAARLDIDGDASIYGNEGDLRLLLGNLLRNALLFRREEQTCIVGISIQQRDQGCHITVRDNGIGIAEQFHERIFEMFFRLHPRDRYPGYGTGLTECQMVARLHEGEVRVQPVSGEGSCFVVELKNLPQRSAAQKR